MNFFDEFVIPASANHVLLIKYMLIISLMLFIPYVCMMLGASFISTHFNRKGKAEGNPLYSRFAKDIIEKLSISPNAELALGSIPAISAFFAYAQLLYTAKTIAMSMMALSVILFITAFVFIYKYRNTFRLGSILHSLKKVAGKDALESTDENIKHVEEFEESVESSNNSTGNAGKWLLLTATYIFSGTMALASNPERWASVNNVLQVIFSWQTIFNFLAFAALAGILSGGAILFYFFRWNGGLEDMTDEYASLIKNSAGTVAMWSGILFPLFLLISYAYLPAAALSPGVFYYMVIVLIISLILGSFIYSMVKNSDTGSATLVFGLIILLISFNILKDQLAFGNAVHDNTMEITKISDEHEKEARNKTLQTTGVDVEAIFKQKCSACHKFDQKVVGPPYQLTVPKYNGDVQKLSEYIFNPQKIDPAFPPMPNQGLKKKEATAMAKWLIDQVGKK